MIAFVMFIVVFVTLKIFDMYVIFIWIFMAEQVVYGLLPERVYENGMEIYAGSIFAFLKWEDVSDIEMLDDRHYVLETKSTFELTLPDGHVLPSALRSKLEK